MTSLKGTYHHRATQKYLIVCSHIILNFYICNYFMLSDFIYIFTKNTKAIKK